MKKLNCCETKFAKSVQITITNSGNEPKTWRAFNGSTNLPSVDDNIQVGEPEIQPNIPVSPNNYINNYVSSVNKLYLGGTSDFKIIDTTTNSVIATLPIISYSEPFYNNGNFVYALSSFNPEIYCININTNTIDNTITFPSGYGVASDIDSDENGNLYALCSNANGGLGALLVINTSTGLITNIVEPLGVTGLGYLAIVNNTIYCISGPSDQGVEVDANTLLITNTFSFNNMSNVKDLKVFNNKLFVAGINISGKAQIWVVAGSASIDEIDLLADFSLGGYFNRTNDPSGTYILYPTRQGVAKINTINNSFAISNPSMSYWMVEYVPDSGYYYASSDTVISPSNRGRVDVFDFDSNTFIQSLTNNTFDATRWLTYDNNNDTIYATNIGNQTPININVIIPVTITVNGGQTSLEQLNQENRIMPFGMCGMTISTSDLSVFQYPITKVLYSSAGVKESYPINLQSYVTAMNVPGTSTITIPEKDLKQNPRLDGINFLQGVIKGNSSMSMIVKYCEWDYYSYLEGIPYVPKKKRYTRASFRFLKAD